VFFVCGTWGMGIKEGGGVGDSLDFWAGGGEDLLGVWKRGMKKKKNYFVCDFNERWLKDSSFIYCFDVLLSVEGRVFFNDKNRIFPLVSISTFFLGQRV
jgi:hypothetical protein